MRYLSSSFFALIFLWISNFAYSNEPITHTHQQDSAYETPDTTIRKIAIENTPIIVTENKPVTVKFKLLNNGKPLTLNDLKEVHTKKIHLLVIDQSLTDYHHIHPQANASSPEFTFNFTPKKEGAYRIWADITPLSTSKQEFLMSDIGTPAKEISVEKTEKLQAVVGAYVFNLKLNGEPKANQEIMATLTVTKNGHPYTGLEPVMGAFSHVVGFYADNSSVIHTHPMGKEPNKASDRGGPELGFHMELKKPGFIKLFAQFQIDGNDVYVPFGILVK